jgi:hypothetical protein
MSLIPLSGYKTLLTASSKKTAWAAGEQGKKDWQSWFDEQDEDFQNTWKEMNEKYGDTIKDMHKTALLPSERAAYARGEMSGQEKEKLFEGNPEFKEMNEDPPDSVEKVMDEMKKQAKNLNFNQVSKVGRVLGASKQRKLAVSLTDTLIKAGRVEMAKILVREFNKSAAYKAED